MTKLHPLSPMASPAATRSSIEFTVPSNMYDCIGTGQMLVPVSSQSRQKQKRQSPNHRGQRTMRNYPTDNVFRSKSGSENLGATNDHSKNISSSRRIGRDSIQSNSKNSEVSVMELVSISPQPTASLDLTSSASMDNESDDDVASWQEDLLHENRQRPSNERLLCTAFISFFGFASIQTVAAIIAGSEAMMGDSAAMMVDAFTYLFNLLAERQKNQYKAALSALEQQHKKRRRQRRRQIYRWRLQAVDSAAGPSKAATNALADIQQQQQLDDTNLDIQEHYYRLKTLRLELIPPVISVSALMVVTVVVAKEAIHVLSLDFGGIDEDDAGNTTTTITDNDGDDRMFHRSATSMSEELSPSLQKDPNLHLMMLFSFLNFLLDGLNVFCFAKADHAAGYATTSPRHDTTHHTSTVNYTHNHHHHHSPSNTSRRRTKRRRNFLIKGTTANQQQREVPEQAKEMTLINKESQTGHHINYASSATLPLHVPSSTGPETTNDADLLNLTGSASEPVTQGAQQHDMTNLQNDNRQYDNVSSISLHHVGTNGTTNHHVEVFGGATSIEDTHPPEQEQHIESSPKRDRTRLIPLEIEEDLINELENDDDEKEEESNLNMCSAYTHVFADTLRSAAVIIAAGIAEFVDAVTPELADASAALVVSVLIFLSLIPLFSGLVQTIKSLRETNVVHQRAVKRLGRLQQLNNREGSADDTGHDEDGDEEEGLLQADYSNAL